MNAPESFLSAQALAVGPAPRRRTLGLLLGAGAAAAGCAGLEPARPRGPLRPRTRSRWAALLLALGMAGCGGGGGGDTEPPPADGALTIRVDTARAASVAATPADAASAVVSAADGTGLALTLVAGAVDRDTTVTIAPISSAQGLPRDARFVAGVRAGPAGTRFDAPVRLHAELPAGRAASPLGFRGLLIDADGAVRELPAALDGRRVTLGVPHFSDVIVVENDFMPAKCDDAASISPQAVTACAAFADQLASLDAPIEALLEQQLELLQDWVGALVVRAGQADSEGADAGGVYRTLLFHELPLFAMLYGTFGDPFAGLDDRPLAAQLDTILDSMEGALLRVTDRLVAACLADKAGAVASMTELDEAWEQHGALFTNVVVGREHCLDIDLQGQVLQSPAEGLPGQVSVALNYRFADGTPAAGEPGLETMAAAFTASQATVAPAGGVVDLPFEQVLSLSLAPGATSTALTATLTPTVPGLAQTTRELPVTVNQPACEVPQGDTVWQGIATIGAQSSGLSAELRFEPGTVSGTGAAFGQAGVAQGTVTACAISLGLGFNSSGSVTFEGVIAADGKSMSGTHDFGGTWTLERQ